MLTYSYQTQRLFAPLFVFVVAVIYLRKRLVSFFIFLIAYAVIVSPIYLLTLSNSKINASFNGLSILWRPNPIGEFINGYVGVFLPYFNFQAGDPNIMHHVPGIGSSYDFLSLFFYVGILLCICGAFNKLKIRNLQRSTYYLILAWTFLFPIPVSLTFYPTVLRVIHGLPLIVLFFIVSFSFLKQFVTKNGYALFYVVVIVIGFIETFSFMEIYLYDYPKISYNEFQYGIEDYTQYLFTHESEFSKVVIDTNINQPYIYYLFYSKFNPRELNYTNPQESSRKYTFSSLANVSFESMKIQHTVSFGSNTLYVVYSDGRQWYVRKM
jgi:hypothetical protein